MTRSSGKRGPTPLGTLLEGSGKLRGKSDRMDRGRWTSLVGERIGARTRPGSLRNGCLTIHVASAVWAQELSLLSTPILERLVHDGFKVKELRFRVGDIGEAPEKRAVVEQAPVPKAELPKGLAERLAHIEDPVLRAAIAEAASYSLGRNEGRSLERTDRHRRGAQEPREKTGEAGASWPSGGARRATREAPRIGSEVERSAPSAERRESLVRETAKLESSAEPRRPRGPRSAAPETAPRAPSPVPRSGAPGGNAGKRSR
jgi:hypothetical protein